MPKGRVVPTNQTLRSKIMVAVVVIIALIMLLPYTGIFRRLGEPAPPWISSNETHATPRRAHSSSREESPTILDDEVLDESASARTQEEASASQSSGRSTGTTRSFDEIEELLKR